MHQHRNFDFDIFDLTVTVKKYVSLLDAASWSNALLKSYISSLMHLVKT